MKNFIKFTSLIITAFFLSSCIVNEDTEKTVSGYNSLYASSSTSSAYVKSVSITGSTSIEYNASTTLTASVTTSGSPTITYTWKITSGSSYASLDSTSGESVTLTANNTSESAQTVTVQVSASDGTNTVTATHDIAIAEVGVEVADEVTGVAISLSSDTISAKGSTTLTASPTYTGSPSITYTWEITSGTDYASLSSSSGESVTLTGKNETSSAQTVSVKVTASDGSSSATSEAASITVKEKASTSSSYNSSSTVDSSYSSVIYLDLGSALVCDDNDDWVEIETSAVSYFDDSVKVKFIEDDSGDSTGLIRVNAKSFSGDLAVYISGTNDTDLVGGVKIQSNASDNIAVYLNDADITSTNYPCVEVTKGSPALVDISGTNTFTDGREYGTGYGAYYTTDSSLDGMAYDDEDDYVYCASGSVVTEGSDSKGTLYCKGDMTLSGDGSLSVSQSYKNCIASKATLTIDGGTYDLTSTGKNGLMADSSIVVNDGSVTFNGTGAISSSACRKANGLKTDTDDSSSSVYIKGGSLDITAYNGKGINSSKVYISGGTNNFDITGVTNYTSDNNKTGTYYDADGVKYSNASITFAAEGVEGASEITISGGKTYITSTDDSVNVSDDGGVFTLSDDGYLYCYSTGSDGVDSNGSIYIKGGVVVSYAPTGSEDALDCGDNYKIYVTGGVIAGTCGSSNGTSSLSTSGQKVLYFTGSSSSSGQRFALGGGQNSSSSSSSSSFSKVAVQVSSSNVYAYTLPSSSFGVFFMSSPDFTSSSTSAYTVYTSPTFSGGTDFKGLYASEASETTMPTITTGSSTSTPSIK